MNFDAQFALWGHSFAHAVNYKKTILTFAQVRALRATPVVIVPAKGSWNIIQLVAGLIRLVAGATPYTESADNLVVRYTNGSGVAVSNVIEMTGFITGTVNMHTQFFPVIDPIVVGTSATNQPLVLHNNGDGEFGNNGTGTLTVHTLYRVIDVR